MAHIIRLRGAWTVERLVAPAGGVVRLKRDFGCSSGVKSASRVWLSIANASSLASAELNGSSLSRIDSRGESTDDGGATSQSRFDVTALLRPRNTLMIEFPSGAYSPGDVNADDWADVRLEIEE